MSTEAEKAAAISAAHKEWILQTLADEGGSCKYQKIVEVGETKACDTVGAMLKLLKKEKKITFQQQFLMYPMHKDEVVSLAGQ
mmetsp:Transcript_82400/g.176477  ORF Transcript_82400/g.176477 Transcript_82400/m.176477 type:complete len:83 (-) Transcript_82400:306-554(-)|eukprot:CAMPEP_0180473290 /NCGR_PEP_ID=MMETSP1036_2-20121128/30080_1 /TAXON_ID=632150 /ORGANISM="Azadinium spinosum, Strain 3D9" /LENGTH=82 /DNA_ID=CAMNT_0022480561 /DNA_START=62 /DNA_END=310 /DNA_ORIENTATION=+